MSQAPPSSAPRRVRLPPRRLAAVLGVWVVAAGGALLIANALDSPVDEGARDEAQAVAPGPVAVPGAGGAAASADASLPPLALVLDRAPPDGIGDLPPAQQVGRLTELARTDPEPRRLMELGSALLVLGDVENATVAFRGAVARAPGDVAARAGLIMAEGAGGGAAGLAQASAGLDELARENPESQLVAFNQGWVEIYRRRAGPAERAWRRTVALDSGSLLGSTAAALLETLEARASGAAP